MLLLTGRGSRPSVLGSLGTADRSALCGAELLLEQDELVQRGQIFTRKLVQRELGLGALLLAVVLVGGHELLGELGGRVEGGVEMMVVLVQGSLLREHLLQRRRQTLTRHDVAFKLLFELARRSHS